MFFYNDFKCCGSSDVCFDVSNKDERIYPCCKSLLTNSPSHHIFSVLYPFNSDRHDYLTHEEVCSYLKAYADKFHLRPHIRFESAVLNLEKQSDKWIIKYENNNQTETEQFDFVMVCSGAYGFPRQPNT